MARGGLHAVGAVEGNVLGLPRVVVVLLVGARERVRLPREGGIVHLHVLLSNDEDVGGDLLAHEHLGGGRAAESTDARQEGEAIAQWKR